MRWEQQPAWTFLRSVSRPSVDADVLSLHKGIGVVVKGSVEGNYNRTPENLDRYQAVRRGDVVVNRMKAWQGTSGVSDLDGIISAHYLVFEPTTQLHDRRFLDHLLRSEFMRQRYEKASIGIRTGQWELSRTAFAELPVPVPPLETQRRIADYLDTETARIDTLINKNTRLSELIRERDGSYFMAAVNAEGGCLPDSVTHSRVRDHRWPQGWRLITLGQTLRQLTNGYVGPTRDVLVDEGVRYVQSLHIKDGAIDFERRPYFVPREWFEQRPRIQLAEGDVLIVQTGDIGQVAYVPGGFGEASCHALQIARPRPELLTSRYLVAYLRSRHGNAALLRMATGALHPHLEGSIRAVPIPVPSLEVQRRIADRDEGGRESGREIRGTMDRQVRLLRERRQVLITAAVTGEIEV